MLETRSEVELMELKVECEGYKKENDQLREEVGRLTKRLAGCRCETMGDC